MFKKLISVCLVVAAAALTACGGSNTITGQGGGGGGGGGGTAAASVQVLASAPQLPSDVNGLATVDMTAVVRDANNVVLAGVPVFFSANANGSLAVIDPATNANGTALARLSNGTDLSNRPITVTVTAGTVSGSVVVNVTGTRIRLTPPSATLSLGDAVAFTAVLEDSAGLGISGRTVAISSVRGNGLSATSLTTGLGGAVQFTLTATQSGLDTLSASSIGTSAQSDVSVSGDSFSITTPAQNAEIALGAVQNVTATLAISGVPQVGQTISFTSTRGTLSSSTAVTNGSGQATVTISSNNSGPALITAATLGGTQTTRNVEFVAVTANSLTLQAQPFTVQAGAQSTITAIVRDANLNLVKNKVVSFQIITDTTNGSLSVAQDTTDSQGRATTFYTGGASSGGVGGVQIRAFVLDTPAVENLVNLTVGGQALAISLGTGNALFEIGTATFAKEWVILVTDIAGTAVAGQNVQASIRSVNYRKGNLWVPPAGDAWGKQVEGICPDEDVNLNGILDLVDNVPGTGEDLNGSGLLEAGNIALVAAVPTTAPAANPCAFAGAPGQAANVVTNAQGFARVCVFYPQNYNLWLDARIQAQAGVAGTETTKSQTFTLEALAADISNTNASPPGVVSPFGADPDCAVPPPP